MKSLEEQILSKLTNMFSNEIQEKATLLNSLKQKQTDIRKQEKIIIEEEFQLKSERENLLPNASIDPKALKRIAEIDARIHEIIILKESFPQSNKQLPIEIEKIESELGGWVLSAIRTVHAEYEPQFCKIADELLCLQDAYSLASSKYLASVGLRPSAFVYWERFFSHRKLSNKFAPGGIWHHLLMMVG